MATFGVKETHHKAKREKCDSFTLLYASRAVPRYIKYTYMYIYMCFIKTWRIFYKVFQ